MCSAGRWLQGGGEAGQPGAKQGRPEVRLKSGGQDTRSLEHFVKRFGVLAGWSDARLRMVNNFPSIFNHFGLDSVNLIVKTVKIQVEGMSGLTCAVQLLRALSGVPTVSQMGSRGLVVVPGGFFLAPFFDFVEFFCDFLHQIAFETDAFTISGILELSLCKLSYMSRNSVIKSTCSATAPVELRR